MIDAVPDAQIGLEDSLLIKRLLQHGPVSMQFSFANKIRSDVQIPNVIAEIPGSELPDQVVIIGAHLDSWQPGTGAQDNGTGAATVLEAARAIKALNRPPRRTIRFILFGGEEEGLLGSHAYVRQHMADLPKIDAVLVTDTGAEPAKGWYLMGREDERPPLASLNPLLAGLGADGISSDTGIIFQTDHAPFDVLGVPSLVLWTGMDKYGTLHHKASDTFDSVVAKDLTQSATVVTVTAYAIADSSAAIRASSFVRRNAIDARQGRPARHIQLPKKVRRPAVNKRPLLEGLNVAPGSLARHLRLTPSFRAECPALLVLREAPGHAVEESLFDVCLATAINRARMPRSFAPFQLTARRSGATIRINFHARRRSA